MLRKMSIYLTNISGRKYLQGIDSTGLSWRQFELDYHNYPERGRCFLCGKELEFGWNNLEHPANQVCDNEIDYENKNTYFFQDELEDSKYIDNILSDVISNNWWQ